MSTTPQSMPPLLGLDIETDTTVDGLDPTVGRVLAVAVARPDGVTVFDDNDESQLLSRLDGYLAAAEPGVLATWNGGGFDLPYLATRAARTGVEIGLRLRLDATLDDHHEPLAGHAGAYRATWHRHRHLDVYRLSRAEVDPTAPTSCSLKAVARAAGLRPIEVDTSQVHRLRAIDLAAYVASDARCTLELTRQRWPEAQSWIDESQGIEALR